jgi:hypothetical protein
MQCGGLTIAIPVPLRSTAILAPRIALQTRTACDDNRTATAIKQRAVELHALFGTRRSRTVVERMKRHFSVAHDRTILDIAKFIMYGPITLMEAYRA